MQGKKQLLELDMEQQTGSKLGKKYVKAVYCHSAYLIIWSTSCKMLGWMKHKLESRLLGEISITSDIQMTPPLVQKVNRNWRAFWWKWKKKVKKLAYNSTFKKLRSWNPVPSLHGKWMGKKWKQWETLFSWAPKSMQIITAAVKLKDACSLEEKLWPT